MVVNKPSLPESLVEGEDYYWEGEAMVFTERFHLRRGYCCDSGCRHCPYGEAGRQTGNVQAGGGVTRPLPEIR